MQDSHSAPTEDIQEMVLPCAPRVFLALVFGAGVVAGVILAAIAVTIAWR